MSIQEMLNEISKLHLEIGSGTLGIIELEEKTVALMAIYDMYVVRTQAERLLAQSSKIIPITRKKAA